MKTLYLLRHAKSSWDDPTLRDFDRPLNERGERAAPLVGRHLRSLGARPEIVVSSPAARARQTADLFIAAADLAAPLSFDERIYEADLSTLLEVVRGLDPGANSALLVGHNPGFESLLGALTGAGRAMPTAALACVALEVEDWAAAAPGAGRLEWFVKPKDLTGG